MLGTKEYFECYAALTLSEVLKIPIENMINSEKPDIQNKNDNMWIEVTQAISEHQGLTNSISRRYFGKGLSGEDIQQSVAEKYNNFNGEISVVNELVSSKCGKILQ